VVEVQATQIRKFLARTTDDERDDSLLMLKKTSMICIWIALKCRETRMKLSLRGKKLLFRALLCAICEVVSAKSPRYPLQQRPHCCPERS